MPTKAEKEHQRHDLSYYTKTWRVMSRFDVAQLPIERNTATPTMFKENSKGSRRHRFPMMKSGLIHDDVGRGFSSSGLVALLSLSNLIFDLPGNNTV